MSSPNTVDRLESAEPMTETQTRTKGVYRRLVKRRRLPVAGLLAVGVSVLVNGLVFLVADAVGAFPAGVLDPGSGQPFSLFTVAVPSAVGAVGATVVYAVFRRFVPDADRWFRRVAGVVLLASFLTPFSIPDAPTATVVTLLVMHVVVAVVSVAFLTADGATSETHD